MMGRYPSMMERNGDLRKAVVSGIGGLPRRRQRATGYRDSIDENRQMDLQESLRLRDRELLLKKDRDQEILKRRRVDRQQRITGGGGAGESYRDNEISDSSDEEYYEEEEEALKIHQQNRMNPPPPAPSSIRSNNRRSLRTLRSSPVLRAAVDEVIGVPIPRRTRSTSAKRSYEHRSSGSGGFVEDSTRRRFSPSPATASGFGTGGTSTSSSGGASMKKKMKSAEPRVRTLNTESNSSRPNSVIQDEIEFEVAEALFDLMKQSQSSINHDRDGTNSVDNELKRDENNAFSVQMEQSVKVDSETAMVDSMELEKEERIKKDEFANNPVQESVCEDEFLDKGKVVSPKESESPSRVKVNACKFQDPTATKADYEAVLVETKKEPKLKIDLMAPPTLSSSPDKDVSFNMESNLKAVIEDVPEKIGTTSKGCQLAVPIRSHEEKMGPIRVNQSPNHDMGKRGLKEQKNQSPASMLPFPLPMTGWPGVLPHPGYLTHMPAVLPINESSRSSIAVQPPAFKFSQPRPKRCATHQYIARNIQHHQQLIKKCLWSGPTGATSFYGTKPLNLNYMSSTDKFVPGNLLLGDLQGGQNLAAISGSGSGKDKSSEVATNSTSNKLVPQETLHQSPAHKFLHGGPAFIFPFGHHQTTATAPANNSGPPQSTLAVGDASLSSNPSVNLAAAMSFNHRNMSLSEANPYMALLQKNGYPFPISPNIPIPPLKGVNQAPSMVPFYNSSLYSSPMFNNTQNPQQLPLPHAQFQSSSQNTSTSSGSSSHNPPFSQKQSNANLVDNKFSTSAATHSQQPEKQLPLSHSSSKSITDISRKLNASVTESHSMIPSNGQTFSVPLQPINFPMLTPGTINTGAAGNKHGDLQQRSNKGRVDLIPQALGLSFGSNSSGTVSAHNFHMLPDLARNGYQTIPVSQKNFQASEGKCAVGSANLDDGLKGMFGKPESNGGQSLNFSKSGGADMSAVSAVKTSIYDGLAHTVKQAYPSSQAVLTSGCSVTVPNFQQQQHQQQLIQLQKHHMQQMQMSGTSLVKSSNSPNSTPGSLLSSSFPSNNLFFTKATPQWENFPKTTAPEGSSQSAASILVNIPQETNSAQAQTHLPFGSVPVSAAQQIGSPSNSPLSKNTVGTLRSASNVGSINSGVATQQPDASPNGPGQKSSPACRRNVPSILSTCPSQLSELKY